MSDTRLPARRGVLAVLAVLVVAGGLAARTVLPDGVGGPLGDALYATLVVLLVALVRPRTSAVTAALAGWVISAAVESAQLTNVPAAIVDRFAPARWVLGTTFVATDLAWYAGGAALGGLLVAAARARDRGPARHDAHPRGRRKVWPLLVAAPLAVVLAAGGAGAWVVRDEAHDLRTTLPAARALVEESAGRVADDAPLVALRGHLSDADALLAQMPLLERRPGDAARARAQILRDATAVAASRLTHAEADAGAARDALAPVTARGQQVVDATDGLGAPDDVRAALVDALAAAAATEGQVSTLTTQPASTNAWVTQTRAEQVEAATAELTASATAVHDATVALMTAQDAVTCPFPDQMWFPEAGHLSDADLAAIPWAPGFRIRADLVPSLVALNDAFRARFGQSLSLNSAYRSFEDQVEVFNPSNPNPLAAPPGCSNHGLGTAIDIAGISTPGSAQFAWLAANAPTFGWVNPDWAQPTGRLPEPWHWQHVSTPTTY